MRKHPEIIFKSFLVLMLSITSLCSLDGMLGAPSYFERSDMIERYHVANHLRKYLPTDFPIIHNTPEFKDEQILDSPYWHKFKGLSDYNKNSFLNSVINTYIPPSGKLYFYDEFRSYCIGCLMMGAKLSERNRHTLEQVGIWKNDELLLNWVEKG